MKYLFLFMLFVPLLGIGQIFQDDFSDGNFNNNPTWLGDTSVFIVNSNNELQLNDTTGGTAQIYAPVAIADSTVWEFYIRMEFAPSTSNQLKVFLMADNSDFTASLNGYFLQIGESGSTDAIEIYKQTGSNKQLLLRATNSAMGSDPAEARIKIIRDNSGNWELFVDYSNGTSLVSEGTFFDNAHTLGSYFGFYSKYTNTRKDKFFFDDISISPLFVDNIPPVLQAVSIINANSIAVKFNEPISVSSAQQIANYSIQNIGNPNTALLDGTDPSLVHLTFPNSFNDGQNYMLTVSNISDANGNILSTSSQSFTFYHVQQAVVEEVLITEIMADPTPAVLLPEVEYVEIFNNSTKTFNLSDLIFYNSSTAFSLPDQLFLSGDYWILCDVDDTSAMSNFQNVIGILSFSALSNSGDDLKIQNSNGDILHEVSYTNNWYGDPNKANGGYALELKNPNLVCIGAANWQASAAAAGGTPSQQNSVFEDTPDTEAPEIGSVISSENTIVTVVFNEVLDEISALQAVNYTVSNGIGAPFEVNLLSASTVELLFSNAMSNNTSYTLTVANVADCSGNAIGTIQSNFTNYDFATPQLYDILVTEIYADPTPSLGLPELEYIELYNRSSSVFNLRDFELTTNGSNLILTDYVLQPNEYVAIHQATIFMDFSMFGNRLGVEDFPALANSGDNLKLYNANGELVHFVHYSNTWYGEADKANGGRSLEMISTENYCQNAENWSASRALNGGTPGHVNSIDTIIIDEHPPIIIRAFPHSASEVELFFNETINVNRIENVANYSITSNIQVVDAQVNTDDFQSVILTLGQDLALGEIYTISCNNIEDCQGNINSENLTVPVALPQNITPLDLIINEILFNPETGGVDFLEIYNHSDKVLNLNDLKIGNTENGLVDDFVELELDYLIFPQTYTVITENPTDIDQRYFHVIGLITNNFNRNALIQNDLPSFPDDAGGVMLLNQNGEQIDLLEYSEDWHHPLLMDKNGVSLERIDFSAPTNDQNNWHSAAATNGHATPTYLNSQATTNSPSGDEVLTFEKSVFSPDGDGFEDFLLLHFNLSSNDAIANIRIFDAKGRLIKTLTQNHLLGTQSTLKWDGTSDNGTKARLGIHVVFVELIHTDGEVQRIKKTCVVAGRW